jgi:hypothetical protein
MQANLFLFLEIRIQFPANNSSSSSYVSGFLLFVSSGNGKGVLAGFVGEV